MQFKKILFVILTVLSCVSVFAQEYYMPLNRDYMSRYEDKLYRIDNDFHTDVKPYRINDIRDHLNRDSVNNTFYFNATKERSWVHRKFRSESLVLVSTPDFSLSLDPIYNAELGYDKDTKEKNFVNTRGAMINGTIDQKLSFSSSIYESQAAFSSYIDAFATTNGVIPGQGPWKIFKTSGKYDYAFATGYVSYSPSKHFNFQGGSDKNFIGDGYRSLLLSDAAFSYPFFKITTSVWHIKYVNLYTSMINIDKTKWNYDDFDKKLVSMHYLSWNVIPRVTLGFFEAIVFRKQDSTSYRGFDVNYLNPVIFYRPVEYSLSSSDNALMGFTQKIKLTNSLSWYSQELLDEFKLGEVKAGKGWHGNKQAVQCGLKYFNVAGIKKLNWQAEFNYVRPFTYSHYNTTQNYAHYNQPLAHPLGANFKEALTFINYRYKSFFLELKYSYAVYGDDLPDTIPGKTLNYGKDVYRSYQDLPHGEQYGYYVGSGLRNTLSYLNVRMSYIINPKTNSNIEFGITRRRQNNATIGTVFDNIVSFGIRTSLTNLYYDF